MVARRLLVLVAALAGCRGEALAPPTAVPAPSARAQAPRVCGAGEVDLEGICTPVETAYASATGTTFFVDGASPAASDAGPGTADRPWRTIARAARRDALRPGDAVVIREGVYRESVRPASGGRPGARVTYAAYPGETVVLTGADSAETGWARQPDGAWRRAWTGPALPAYDADPVFRRELVVAAGRVLRPVASRRELVPGTFWVEGPDVAPVAVYVRFPEDRRPEQVRGIEIATRRHLFAPVGDDVHADCGDPGTPGWFRVVGLTLRHAANRAQWGALCAGSEGGLVEDVTVEWTIGMGVDGSGRGHRFRRVRADHNGQAGWGASCRACVFEDGTAIGNNWRGHDLFWEAGGGKWNDTHDTVIRRFHAAGNDGPGLWLDGQNTRNTIEDCLVDDNEGAGIMLELETTETLVQHNIVRATRWREWTGTGILSQAASRNVLLHNTVVANEGTGVWIRLDPLRRAPEGGNVVANNWIVGNARDPRREAREISIEAETRASLRSNTLAGNVYGAVSGDPTLRSPLFASPTADGDYRGRRLSGWREAVGADAGSQVLDGEGTAHPPPPARRVEGGDWAGARGTTPRPAPRVGAQRTGRGARATVPDRAGPP